MKVHDITLRNIPPPNSHRKYASGHTHDCADGSCSTDHSTDSITDPKSKIEKILHDLFGHSDAGHRIKDETLADLNHNQLTVNEVQIFTTRVKDLDLSALKAISTNNTTEEKIKTALLKIKDTSKGQGWLIAAVLGGIAGLIALAQYTQTGKPTDHTPHQSTEITNNDTNNILKLPGKA